MLDAILVGMIDGEYRYDVRHVERVATELRLAGLDPGRATARQIAGALNMLNHQALYEHRAYPDRARRMTVQPKDIQVRYQADFPVEAETARARAELERRADDIASRLDWPNGVVAQIAQVEPETLAQRLSAMRVRLRYLRLRFFRLLGWTS